VTPRGLGWEGHGTSAEEEKRLSKSKKGIEDVSSSRFMFYARRGRTSANMPDQVENTRSQKTGTRRGGMKGEKGVLSSRGRFTK